MIANPLPKPTKASKSGTEPRIILQDRDSRLLRALSTLRILDREQTAAIAGFNSITRVNTRLQKLTQAGLLRRFFFVSVLGGKKAVYSLSKKGADLIGTAPNGINRPKDSFLIGDKFTSHQLAINQVYCAACFAEHIKDRAVQKWRILSESLSKSIPLIPDSYFELHIRDTVRPMFLEVDLGTESLSVWTKKTNEYLSLAASGEFERLFSHPRFAVLVVIASERRMQSLRAHIGKITSKLFYFSTLEKVRASFWSEAWLRPEGEQFQSLT